MTIEGHNDLIPAIEAALKEATEPLDCHQLFDMPAIRSAAPNVNRVSDYLGMLYRRGMALRVANSDRDANSRARWAYIWKKKEEPDWKKPADALEYRPKTILDRPNIYINETGDYINIELPELTITIKKKK
jgi:hypothetical protein